MNMLFAFHVTAARTVPQMIKQMFSQADTNDNMVGQYGRNSVASLSHDRDQNWFCCVPTILICNVISPGDLDILLTSSEPNWKPSF